MKKNKGKVGITFGAFDMFHSGHILMLQDAKEQCNYLIVGVQTDPSFDRPDSKNKPIQTIVERQLQVKACKWVDSIIVYETEQDLLDILHMLNWDIRIVGEEYRNKNFTGRDEFPDREIFFNKRTHRFSSSELRDRTKNKSN